MHIHISERDLKTLKFKFKLIEGKLNIQGYKTEKLKGKVCPKCLLKSFKSSEVIDVENLNLSKACSCYFKVSPSINIRVDAKKNPEILFA